MRLDRGRFTLVSYPRDAQLARTLLERALASDTFPGLPRPARHVLIAIAPDQRRFREWIGPAAPEWGEAVAFPDEHRIVMQGSAAASTAGDPREVLRHELAHLALHEVLGELPPRWFSEGYASFAAREWGREQVLATNVALAVRGAPSLAALDSAFSGGASRASAAYALSYRAVAELAALDPDRGLALFVRYWRETGSLDLALRRAYGLTEEGFEKWWQQRTRRRYGALALFTDFALFGLVLAALMLPLAIARRRRNRRRMEALMATEQEAERIARENAIEELLRSVPPPPTPPRGEERA